MQHQFQAVCGKTWVAALKGLRGPCHKSTKLNRTVAPVHSQRQNASQIIVQITAPRLIMHTFEGKQIAHLYDLHDLAHAGWEM